MDNKLKLCGDYTTWSNVPFEDIVDRVSAQKKSSNLPYVRIRRYYIRRRNFKQKYL